MHEVLCILFGEPLSKFLIHCKEPPTKRRRQLAESDVSSSQSGSDSEPKEGPGTAIVAMEDATSLPRTSPLKPKSKARAKRQSIVPFLSDSAAGTFEGGCWAECGVKDLYTVRLSYIENAIDNGSILIYKSYYLIFFII